MKKEHYLIQIQFQFQFQIQIFQHGNHRMNGTQQVQVQVLHLDLQQAEDPEAPAREAEQHHVQDRLQGLRSAGYECEPAPSVRTARLAAMPDRTKQTSH